jgi:hypothetical protein
MAKSEPISETDLLAIDFAVQSALSGAVAAGDHRIIVLAE